jgi:hypothetical protein
VLALARIIVGQQTCCASVPPSAEPVAHFQAHAGVALNIEDASGFHAVFCYDPELPDEASVTHGSAVWLSGLPSNRFEESILRRRQTQANTSLIGGLNNYFCSA